MDLNKKAELCVKLFEMMKNKVKLRYNPLQDAIDLFIHLNGYVYMLQFETKYNKSISCRTKEGLTQDSKELEEFHDIYLELLEWNKND